MYRLPRALRLRQQHSIQQPDQLIAKHALGLRTTSIRTFSHAFRRSRPQRLYQPSGEAVRVQAVRFKRSAFFTWRRFATVVLYGGAVYLYGNLVLRYLDVEIEILDEGEEAEEQEAEGGKAAQQDGQSDDNEESGPPFYAAEDSTFVPLTWATKLPRTFYRGSDPEWQAFVKVARDKDRHKKIQNELVQIVYTGAAQHPAIARQLGKEPKVGKYWLDISFPDAPPQEYERSGIEFGDGYIAWSQQKVSPETQWRVQRALWPQAAAESLYTTGKMLVGVHYRRIKQLLGWEGRDPFSPEERFRSAMETMAKGQGHGRAVDAVARGGTAATTTTSHPSTTASDSDSSAKLPWPLSFVSPFNSISPSSSTSPASHPSSDDPSPTLPLAMHTFNRTLSKTWNPKKSEPPRGSFVVQGLVEVRGSRGRMLFDVQSCYDPTKSKFVVVHAAVRNWKRWEQAPRGGP